MKWKILPIFFCCAGILCAGDYGKKIPLKRIAGVEEGAMSAALDGGTLWVGGTRGTLYAFDVSKPDEPKLVATMPVLKNCRQMAVRNGIAALVGRQSGLALVDIRDPRNPKLLSRYQTIELATGVDLTDSCVYVGNRIYGVESVDCSDPVHPRYIGNMLTDEAQSVRAAGNKVFVGDWAAGKIQIADASNPAQLKPLGTVRLDGYGDGVDVRGNLLLASTGHHRKSGPAAERSGNGHGLELWNIADPRRPERLSIFRFPRFYNIGNDFWTVRASGDYAFCADTHNGFFVLNIADPRNPFCVGSAQLDAFETRHYDADGTERLSPLPDAASSIAVGDGVVYITGGKSGLYLAELPGIAVPPEPDRSIPGPAVSAELPPAPAGYAVFRTKGMIREAAVQGDTAFLAASEEGIISVRLTDTGIRELKRYPGHFAFDVKVRGHRLYAAENADGIGIYEIGENGTLTRAGRAAMPWKLDCQRLWAPENTGLLVVSDHSGYLFFLDVSDPSRVKEVFRHNQVGLVYSDLMTHDPVGNYLFFNWHNSGYAWYDVSGGGVRLANWKRTRFATHRGGAAEFGGRCLAVADGGYYLLSPNQNGDPRNWPLVEVSGLSLNGVPSVDGSIAAFVERRLGTVTVLDLTRPDSPRPVSARSFTVPGTPGSASFFRGRLVIPGGYAGLYLEPPNP